MSEIVNVEMAAAWDGPEGASWVEREERQNEALGTHTARLFAAADVGASEHVLDVGCGCGQTTRACARLAVDGDALGVDLSTAMLERARMRAAEEGLANVTFERGDAQVHEFAPARYDLVLSRFGVMFFADPVAAFANLRAAMAPGGRLALLVWQRMDRNEWLTATRGALAAGRDLPVPPTGAPGPFGLADPVAARTILETAGFEQIGFEDVQVPFEFGADADDAFSFAREIGMVRALLQELDADAAAGALDELRATMVEHDSSAGVLFDSRAWLISGVR
jgi:SAM-dependent methyltransferase